jgi:hypothetical protein
LHVYLIHLFDLHLEQIIVLCTTLPISYIVDAEVYLFEILKKNTVC